MNVPSSAILTVLFIGCVLIMPIMTMPMFREGRRVIMTNRTLGVPLLLIFALLFWPSDPGQAFSNDSALGGMRLIRVGAMIGLLLWLTPYFLRSPIFFKKSALNWYLLYIVMCTISASYAPSWPEALWKSFELVVVLAFASVLREEVRRERMDLEGIMAGFTLLIFIAVFFALIGGAIHPNLAYGQWSYSETESLSRSMGGIAPRVNPNTLGQFSAMLLLAGVVHWVLRSRLNMERLLLILIGSAGLFFAHARTSIAAVAIVLFVFLLASRRLTGLMLVAGLIVTGLVGVGVSADYLLRGQEFEQFLTLSGRTTMWSIAWEAVRENPWFGIGYAGHKSLDITLGMEYSTLDNTYLEALVNVGFFGAVFLVLFVGLVVCRLTAQFFRVSSSRREGAVWLTIAAGFVWIMFVRSLVGPSFQAFHWNLVVLLGISAAAVDRVVVCRRTPIPEEAS